MNSTAGSAISRDGTPPMAMEDEAHYRRQAERCRRLARATSAPDVTRFLLELAAEFEKKAEEAGAREDEKQR